MSWSCLSSLFGTNNAKLFFWLFLWFLMSQQTMRNWERVCSPLSNQDQSKREFSIEGMWIAALIRRATPFSNDKLFWSMQFPIVELNECVLKAIDDGGLMTWKSTETALSICGKLRLAMPLKCHGYEGFCLCWPWVHQFSTSISGSHSEETMGNPTPLKNSTHTILAVASILITSEPLC